MPDTTAYTAKLTARRAELVGEVRAIEDALDDAPPKDWEDRAGERQGDEVLEALGTQDLEELRRIDAALARIEAGTFGICAKCGDDIAEERLAAVLDTPFCATCAR